MVASCVMFQRAQFRFVVHVDDEVVIVRLYRYFDDMYDTLR